MTAIAAEVVIIRPGQMAEATTEPRWVRWTLIALAVGFLLLFVAVPLVLIFIEAFAKGWHTYIASLTEPDARSAIKLTLLVAAVAVPLNAVFGVTAAWAITKFTFRGNNLLVTLIDLPIAVSPVISGMIFVLLFGLHGAIG